MAVRGLTCPKCGAQHQIEHKEKPRLRLNSVIAAARCSACGHNAFLKYLVTADRHPAEFRAARDFATAIEFGALFPAQADLRVMTPTSRDGAMLIFDFVPGTSPVAQLKSTSIASAAAMMRRLGNWFGLFHSVCNIGSGPIDLIDRLGELSTQMSIASSRNDIAIRTLQMLRRTCVELPNEPSPYKRLHGDAKPENFWIAGSALIGLDIDGCGRNLPERDLSQFLCNFELTCTSVLGHFDDRRRSAMEAAFIDGYRMLAPLNQELLVWVRAYDLLHRWLDWREAGRLHRFRWDHVLESRLVRFAELQTLSQLRTL